MSWRRWGAHAVSPVRSFPSIASKGATSQVPGHLQAQRPPLHAAQTVFLPKVRKGPSVCLAEAPQAQHLTERAWPQPLGVSLSHRRAESLRLSGLRKERE